ncbi:hypothetical protein [Alteromonas gilva]|uniref:Uncharacterized protein n=1 Tax=Alteromonas gilva TaxID=2987522 RepID=A0ABT5L617_9ALTE|nr:hypothetical protein [Alteromonas gilva]MDC8832503.1 hypothetical protein [Alteromonas gilva]
MDKEVWDIASKASALISIITVGVTLITYHFKQVSKVKTLQEKITSLENGKILKDGNIVFDEILDNVEMVKAKIIEIINEESCQNKALRIDNYGLDLETIGPMFRYTFASKLSHRDIYYRGLVIHPDDEKIAKVCCGNSNLSQSVVQDAVKILTDIDNSTDSNFSIELYAYDSPPIIHGFVIDDEHLFIGFTHFEAGGLVGGATPYMYIKRDINSAFKQSLFKTYNTWFTHWTKYGEKLVPKMTFNTDSSNMEAVNV